MLLDGIYRGWVDHRRHLPRAHAFRYPLAMVMVDVVALEKTFSRSRWWSLERFNLISFYRKDYLQGAGENLHETVCRKISERTGEQFSGTVKILTHPRYLGFVFNPVTFYFCFSAQGALQFIVSEINNTPWNERYAYVLKVTDDPVQALRFVFDKAFHISPFMPMDIEYHWRFDLKEDELTINMSSLHEGQRQFDAVLQATMQPLSPKNMRWLPFQFPMQTLLVVLRIYWQALCLWIKHIPVFSHPNKRTTQSSSDGDKK